MPDVFYKDPAAVDDYTWDWTDWLGDDTISAATVTGTGVTIDDSTTTSPTVVARISGGEAGSVGNAVCHIVTAAGREADQTLYFNIREL